MFSMSISVNRRIHMRREGSKSTIQGLGLWAAASGWLTCDGCRRAGDLFGWVPIFFVSFLLISITAGPAQAGMDVMTNQELSEAGGGTMVEMSIMDSDYYDTSKD